MRSKYVACYTVFGDCGIAEVFARELSPEITLYSVQCFVDGMEICFDLTGSLQSAIESADIAAYESYIHTHPQQFFA